MKKIIMLTVVAFSMAIVSCNNQPKEEEMPIDQAVEEMTEAVADTTTVAPVETAEAVVETTTEAAH